MPPPLYFQLDTRPEKSLEPPLLHRLIFIEQATNFAINCFVTLLYVGPAPESQITLTFNLLVLIEEVQWKVMTYFRQFDMVISDFLGHMVNFELFIFGYCGLLVDDNGICSIV